MNELRLMEEVRSIARAAGRAIMALYDANPTVTFKQDASPLTAADCEAHELIVAGLLGLGLRWPILSEESVQDAVAERRAWQRYWLVDPLDGTKEFLKRNGEFTVNIALIDQHEPRLGVVYGPAKDLEYWGSASLGAWRRDHAGTQRIHAATHAAAEPRVVGSRSHASPALADYLARLGPHTLTSIGSSLKICLVADGQADLYPRFGPTMEWDTAAAQAVLESAGGCMMDLSGQPLKYNSKDELVNPSFLAFADSARDWFV
jgi:3'(2'), 5'-bisphosphate nucleotidase